MRVGRHINEVCQIFDVEVLVDIANDGVGLCDGYKVSHEDTNHDPSTVPLQVRVALGTRCSDTVAVMTRWFRSEEELDEFCELNINRFRIAASEVDAVLPDATEWR